MQTIPFNAKDFIFFQITKTFKFYDNLFWFYFWRIVYVNLIKVYTIFLYYLIPWLGFCTYKCLSAAWMTIIRILSKKIIISISKIISSTKLYKMSLWKHLCYFIQSDNNSLILLEEAKWNMKIIFVFKIKCSLYFY